MNIYVFIFIILNYRVCSSHELAISLHDSFCFVNNILCSINQPHPLLLSDPVEPPDLTHCIIPQQ